MSEFFKGMVEDKTIQAFVSTDGGSRLIETGVYDVLIKKAFFEQSPASQSKSIVISFETIDGRELTTKDTVTTKDGKTFYNYNGKNKNLKGYSVMKAIEYLLNKETDMLPKVELQKVKIFDYKTKTEEIQDKYVCVDWIDKKVSIAIVKTIDYKQIKNQETGKYEKDFNEFIVYPNIVAFLDPITKRTAAEVLENLEAKKLTWFNTKFPNGYVDDKTFGAYAAKQRASRLAPKPTPKYDDVVPDSDIFSGDENPF
jgi:hypothetical protein